MTFAITPTGIRAHIPIFAWQGVVFGDLYWSAGDGSGRRILLHLVLDPDSQASSPHRLSYKIGHPRLTGIGPGKDLDVHPPDAPPSWKEVLIRHRPPLHRAPGQLPGSTTFKFIPAIPMQLFLDAPVRFPEARIQEFLIKSNSTRFEIRGAGLDSRADSSVPTAYIFTGSCPIIIKVGQCQQERPLGEQHRPIAIWATSSVGSAKFHKYTIELETAISKYSTNINHDCSQEHVLQWPDHRKTFRFKPYTMTPETVLEVTLSFMPCPFNPERTLILEASHRVPWD